MTTTVKTTTGAIKEVSIGTTVKDDKGDGIIGSIEIANRNTMVFTGVSSPFEKVTTTLIIFYENGSRDYRSASYYHPHEIGGVDLPTLLNYQKTFDVVEERKRKEAKELADKLQRDIDELLTDPKYEFLARDESGKEQVNVATNIRRHLKKLFLGQKFSVRKDSCCVQVGWTLGPTVEEVKSALSCYIYGHYDIERDCYQYVRDAWNLVFGGVQYISYFRDIPINLTEADTAIIEECYGPQERRPYHYETDEWCYRTALDLVSFPASVTRIWLEKKVPGGNAIVARYEIK